MMTEPVCKTCNDTHKVEFESGAQNCTSCPVPCQRCRAGGKGAYCSAPRCDCDCHLKTNHPPPALSEQAPDGAADTRRRPARGPLGRIRDHAAAAKDSSVTPRCPSCYALSQIFVLTADGERCPDPWHQSGAGDPANGDPAGVVTHDAAREAVALWAVVVSTDEHRLVQQQARILLRGYIAQRESKEAQLEREVGELKEANREMSDAAEDRLADELEKEGKAL